MSVSNFTALSLKEYSFALTLYCQKYHDTFNVCCKLVVAANFVLENGMVRLSKLFRIAFPESHYHTISAKQLLLQIPIVAMTVGNPSNGFSEVYAIEYVHGFDWVMLQSVLSSFIYNQSPSMTKTDLQQVVKLAQGDRERLLIKYTAFRASGSSLTAARKHFGIENLQSC